jgi:acyl-CoA thioester hydrolase
MTLLETYRGSVNRWECDENDHQNVRFYLAKLQQGLLIGLSKTGLTKPSNAPSLLKCVTSHHIRYLREARIAVPQVIHCGVLEHQPGHSLKLLSLMRNSSNNELLATFITDLDLTINTASQLIEMANINLVSAPADALAKGVSAAPSTYARLSPKQALDVGFAQVGAGVISANECSNDGDIEVFQVMGRLSDGMPNLWALFQTDEELQARSNGITGGAVLEYRLTFHQQVQQGMQFSHLAGIHALGNKTQSICHLMYESTTNALLVSAEALGISMDLNTRKSIAIPQARRERISALLLQRLN